MITVGELREWLAAYPPETEVFVVTERHDLRADIAKGGDLVRSSIQPRLIYNKYHNRVSLCEHVALGYINGPGKALFEELASECVPKETEPAKEQGEAITEDKWCVNCGYPLKMKRVRDNWGEHLTFYDGKTGDTIEDCPNCRNWPLDVYGIESKASAEAQLQRQEPWQGNDRAEEWAS